MLAVSERQTLPGGRTEVRVWHKPVGRVMEEFQAIACSDTDGITLPAPKQDVPLTLAAPGERWCTDCLAAIRARYAPAA
ncbi:hypothetical protein [Streptomyces sp. NPDC059761]|uniref:hypothetical protein n=1 Tax=Streptomyces sp. NPDC059761 TaxID=3346937 RepID=UPI00365FE0DC